MEHHVSSLAYDPKKHGTEKLATREASLTGTTDGQILDRGQDKDAPSSVTLYQFSERRIVKENGNASPKTPHQLDPGIIKDALPDGWAVNVYATALADDPLRMGLSPMEYHSFISKLQDSILSDMHPEFCFTGPSFLKFGEMTVLVHALNLFSPKNVECRLFPLIHNLVDYQRQISITPSGYLYLDLGGGFNFHYAVSGRRRTYNFLVTRYLFFYRNLRRAEALSGIPAPILMKLVDSCVEARREHHRRRDGAAPPQATRRHGDVRDEPGSEPGEPTSTRCTRRELAEAVDRRIEYLDSDLDALAPTNDTGRDARRQNAFCLAKLLKTDTRDGGATDAPEALRVPVSPGAPSGVAGASSAGSTTEKEAGRIQRWTRAMAIGRVGLEGE